MSKAEKYLPYILSLLLPGLSLLGNNQTLEDWDLKVVISQYLIIACFLFSLWHVNRYFSSNLVDHSFTRRVGPRVSIVLLNISYILVFISLDYVLVAEVIGLEENVPFFLIAIRLGIAALIFSVFQQAQRAIQQREALKVQNLSLQAENLKSQLVTMKQQINPHFLFNSLNTLLDFIEEDQKKAESFVRAFSNLYRVVLQSSQRDFIMLKDELDFLDNYWKLLKMRFNGAVELYIDISKEKEAYLIPPLSLQLLIENAVKHNLANPEKVLYIEIKELGDSLIVQNKIEPKPYEVPGEGVGLKNLQQRFSLLHRPIEYGVLENVFRVSLPLKRA